MRTESLFRLRPEWSFVLLAFLCVLWCDAASSQSIDTCAPPASSHSYDWESLNYYELLGLTPKPESIAPRRQRQKERSRLQSSDVRKAYRKQAQLYHPDKVKAKSNSTITTEESNARFARIAEAYKVLAADSERQEYDAFLLDCEDSILARQKGTSSSYSSSDSRWSLFDNFSADPRRVFEEFFFGSSSASSWDDVYRDNDSGYSGHSPRQQNPVRVSENSEIRYDLYRGTEVLRVFTTEEYAPDEHGRAAYRIVTQEFVEQYDRYQGDWVYSPIGPRVVMEEGYMRPSDSAGENGPKSETPNVLYQGEILSPESATLLTSANGRYYAGLSPECELLIMSDSSRLGPDAEDSILWSSGTYVPTSHLFRAGGCYLSLQGPHLVVAMGSPNRPGTVLWYSDDVESVAEEEEERIRHEGGPPPVYFARLDDDGSLAVYSQWTVPPRHNDDDEQPDDSTWWSRVLRPGPGHVPQTRAARAWVRLREWTHRILVRYRTVHDARKPRIREMCLYATGPAGCNTPARKLVHFANDVGQSVKHTFSRIENAVDGFIESLGESDEDEDMLDLLLRILGRTGSGIGRAGKRFAGRGARAIRRAIRERLYLSKGF